MNDSIKEQIKKAGLFQYQVADAIGVSEQTLIRWMRYKLSPEKLDRVCKAIDKLTQAREVRND